MYCPKCGAQNVDDASFCRGCGANVSLVPQALAGQLSEAVSVEGKGRCAKKHERDGPANLTYALVKTFVGVAFILVALAVKEVYQIAGHIWWFWMLIPAAGSLGAGVAEFVRLYQQQPNQQKGSLTNNAYVPPAIPDAMLAGELPPRRRSHAEIYTPTSVTEHTTKLLDKDQ
jgi:hypothetical protein